MPILKKFISGWGRYPVQNCELERPERFADLKPHAASVIARGQGRSYGDAALNENGRVLLTERIDRILDLDESRGILHAEAGITLADLLPIIVKKGWFLPVTPGTKFVSLGGCVAADVHGKNHHHVGSFGNHVINLKIVQADGNYINCSPEENSDLFWATIGGMGLTGIIAEVTLKLIPIESSQMQVLHRPANNLKSLFELLQDSELDDTYSVAWIDCLAKGEHLGRGVAMFGHHATAQTFSAGNPLSIQPSKKRTLPFDFPSWVLNPLSIRLFNQMYFRKEGRKTRLFLTDYDSYFYPLDALEKWNRMYGKRGFVQYQCVLPSATALQGMTELLQALSDSRRASFLAVLKRLGPQNKGLLSFPCEGYTLALDLPLHDNSLFNLLDKLDNITLQHGGRVYLAKDARLSSASFRKMYPRLAEWLTLKHRIDPDNRFNSSLSRRLQIGDSL